MLKVALHFERIFLRIHFVDRPIYPLWDNLTIISHKKEMKCL